MSDDCLMAQAAELEWLLPHLMRRLFTLDPDHPIAEMPLAQLRLCSVLQCGPRPLSGLAEMLGISPSAVTQLADRLELSGLVERAPGAGDDRRVKHLCLTPRGEALMSERRTMRREHAAAALRRLPEAARETVLDALRTLADANRPRPADDPEPWTARQEITGD